MSKKRKTNRPGYPGDLPIGMPMAVRVPPEMALQMLGRMAPRPGMTLEAVLAATNESDLVHRSWATTCSKRCCNRDERDSVIVVAGTHKGGEALREIGAEPSFRALAVIAFDAHEGGQTVTAMLDVEDGKRLVNQLSEAIAEIERLPVGR